VIARMFQWGLVGVEGTVTNVDNQEKVMVHKHTEKTKEKLRKSALARYAAKRALEAGGDKQYSQTPGAKYMREIRAKGKEFASDKRRHKPTLSQVLTDAGRINNAKAPLISDNGAGETDITVVLEIKRPTEGVEILTIGKDIWVNVDRHNYLKITDAPKVVFTNKWAIDEKTA
jgi:predicted ribonuclease toxin of YeeF-YezG toxin-antitoxin module